MTRSSRAGRARRWVIFVAALGLAAASRREACAADEAGARALFTEGRQLVASGDYAAACEKFAASYRLDPGVGTSFNLADCEEHVGRTASAWARFLQVASETRAAGQVDRERVARARAAALEPRLSKVVLKVTAPVRGLVLEMDGTVVLSSLWGVARPVDPGEHSFRAAAPGKRAWSSRVTVAASSESTTVNVPPLADARTVAPRGPASTVVDSPQQPTPARVGERRRFSRPVLTLGALGVAALAVGAFFAVRFESENSEAQSLCPTNTCSMESDLRRHTELYNEAKRDRTIYFVSAGVGALSLATATYLWWRSPEHSAPKTSASIRPSLALGRDVFAGAVEIAW